MEISLTNNSKNSKYSNIAIFDTRSIDKYIIDQFELVSINNSDLNDAIIDIEFDDSLFDSDDSDKLQVCHKKAKSVDFSNSSINKRSSKRLIPNKFLHQITFKTNNYNDNYHNDNDNENDSNNNNINNNNNKIIKNYNNNNNNNTKNNNENNNINDSKNNNIFNNIKTKNQKNLSSKHKSKKIMDKLFIEFEKRKNSNKIFNLINDGTILY